MEKSKIVLITGCSSGIGRELLTLFNRSPFRVVATTLPESFDDLSEDPIADSDRIWIRRLNVVDFEKASQIVRETAEKWGTIDILINNAGINVPKRHWTDVSHADWDAVGNIDLNGAFYCTQAVLPGMRAQGEGLATNVSSWAGVRVSFLTGPAYTAAKHAMNAMTESLNMEECINGIRATALCPGEVSTPIMDKRPVPMSAEDRARMVQPEDVGDTLLFVASLPASVCINQLVISPTWNRGYVKFHEQSGPE